jgi:chromosome segregation ATPase
MIPFEAVRFAMLGSAVSEMQHAEQQEYIDQLEHHVREIENHLRSVQTKYEQLRIAYGQLQEYTQSIEAERDDLQNRMQLMLDQFQLVQTEIGKVKEQFSLVASDGQRILQSEGKKLEAYPLMKQLLVGLFHNADRVFTNEINEEYREKVKEFLAGLP